MGSAGREKAESKFAMLRPDPVEAPVKPAGEAPMEPAADDKRASGHEPPIKAKRFTIKKQAAGAPPEGETQQAAETQSAPAFVLSGKLTRMFWSTMLSLARGLVEFVDNQILRTPHPFDTSIMSFTRSEEEMVEEVMPNVTTRILGWFGIKTERAAETFISALVIVRIFGRIALGLVKHYVDEIRRLGAERKEAAAKREKTNIELRRQMMEAASNGTQQVAVSG